MKCAPLAVLIELSYQVFKTHARSGVEQFHVALDRNIALGEKPRIAPVRSRRHGGGRLESAKEPPRDGPMDGEIWCVNALGVSAQTH